MYNKTNFNRYKLVSKCQYVLLKYRLTKKTFQEIRFGVIDSRPITTIKLSKND